MKKMLSKKQTGGSTKIRPVIGADTAIKAKPAKAKPAKAAASVIKAAARKSTPLKPAVKNVSKMSKGGAFDKYSKKK